jgi:mono/diheme cytochrome c family protein
MALTSSSVSWGQEGDVPAGFAYAQSACAKCHAIRGGSLLSPNPDAPTFDKIANTPGITGAALYVILQNTHRKMPDLIIPPKDKADVVAYILSLKR